MRVHSRTTITWVIVFVLALFLTACGGTPSPTPTEETPPPPTEEPEDTPEVEPTEVLDTSNRAVFIIELDGSATVTSASDETVVAEIGLGLAEGDTLSVASDSLVVLELDDGTRMVVAEETILDVSELTGTEENPITRFFLSVGKIFNMRNESLPEEASFEVETPNGVAAIRGSYMAVEFNPNTGQLIVSCLEGDCSLADNADDVTIVFLTDGQQTSIPGFDTPPGEPVVMNPGQIREWIEAIRESDIEVVFEVDADAYGNGDE